MCTIVVLHRVNPDYPVIIAANRDEYYARPTASPHLISQTPHIVAGLDGQKGGTWMGANSAGIFVGLTNQRTFKTADKALRSRGEVTREALNHTEVGRIDEALAALDPRQYNPFNLLYGDAERLRVAYFHEGMTRPEIADVPQGVHVLPNDRLDSERFSKVQRARDLIQPHARAPWFELQGHLQAMLADRFLPPIQSIPPAPRGSMMPQRLIHRLEALCIKTPLYGTRSCAIAALAPGRVARYLATEGPPDEAELKDLSALLTPPGHEAR